MRQYLDCITSRGYQPRIIRSDLGTETTLMAETYFAIRHAGDPTVEKVEDCFWYGRSVDNQRIESWWRQLSNACTGIFHVGFVHLQSILPSA